MPDIKYYDDLPKKPIGVGALFLDENKMVMIVRPKDREELSEFKFVSIDEAVGLVNRTVKNKLLKSFEAIQGNKATIYFEDYF